MSIHVACCTHRGSPPSQQDALLIGTEIRQSDNWSRSFNSARADLLVAVADGVGAKPNSKFVSRAMLAELPEAIAQNPGCTHDDLLSNRHVREAHLRLCAAATHRPRLRGGATTIVAAHVRDGRAVVLNCGDSRAYLRTSDGAVRQLSRDHTELQRLRDNGDAVDGIDYASIYDMLTDCIAADPEESDFAIHRAEVALGPADILVLCSDGVHDALTDAVWRGIIAERSGPGELIAAARAAVLKVGAPDNFTLIALSSSK